MKKIILSVILLAFSFSSPALAVNNCEENEDFCVYPTDAYFAVIDNPKAVILDVRTPEEQEYVGYPAENRNGFGIPEEQVLFADWKEEAFLTNVRNALTEAKLQKPVIYVICRSGGRSYSATKALIEAGYINVFNIIDGFEGDRNSATGTGYRNYNGWVQEGLPYHK